MEVLEPLAVSAGVVGLAEVGDKSLFFGILLTLRYRQPWSVFWGLAVGMTANLSIAALLGAALGAWLSGNWLSWLLGIAFIAMAVGALIPGHDHEELDAPGNSRRSVFATAVIGYFLLEMADKTQVATLALAASYDSVWLVLTGAVIGVVTVNAPAIWLGHQFAGRLPLQALRISAAALFGLLGLWILIDVMLTG